MTTGPRSRRADEAGFSLLEILLALGIISVVMAGAGLFFVRSMSITYQQGERQAAAQYAADLMERIRERPACTLIATASTGYQPCSPKFTLSAAESTQTLDGVAYERSWSATKQTVDTVPMLQVTAEVTWKHQRCEGGECTYTATTLISALTDDPTFNTGTT
jgi:prepilin-type N-terminal cleavage/methylation domain-containing protein